MLVGGVCPVRLGAVPCETNLGLVLVVNLLRVPWVPGVLGFWFGEVPLSSIVGAVGAGQG